MTLAVLPGSPIVIGDSGTSQLARRHFAVARSVTSGGQCLTAIS